MYSNGNGVELNITKAVEFYERASKKGNVKSMNNLAMIYKGDGNLAAAIPLLQRAAEKGNASAMVRKANFFFHFL